MAKTNALAGGLGRTPDLRELIKENDQRVHAFIAHFLAADPALLEETVLRVFRDFGEYYRRQGGYSNAPDRAAHLCIELFKIAWFRAQNASHQLYFPLSAGRDMRLLKGLDEDILPNRNESREKTAVRLEDRIRDRLNSVDTELRAPVVLRDILGFKDEETMQILGLRWGVYRHRLHRGRLDFKEALKGLSMEQPGKGAPANV